uniref:Uncharacterized protein n=1 Tax=Setaria viridis TaxID=4556 RepID=A0A4V6D3Z4_SETVI|nr:hypothetical protein SEVIR_7G090601v2 [Setaria viridis]
MYALLWYFQIRFSFVLLLHRPASHPAGRPIQQ